VSLSPGNIFGTNIAQETSFVEALNLSGSREREEVGSGTPFVGFVTVAFQKQTFLS